MKIQNKVSCPRKRASRVFTVGDSRGRQGVLLLEALLAVMILSVSLVVVIQSLSMSARSVNYSLEYLRAVTLLENQLFFLTRASEEDAAAPVDGPLPRPHQEFYYRGSLRPVPDRDQGILRQLEMEISWGRGESRKRLPLTTYVLRIREDGDE
jgi:Tfp pilus assembly protein PilV